MLSTPKARNKINAILSKLQDQSVDERFNTATGQAAGSSENSTDRTSDATGLRERRHSDGPTGSYAQQQSRAQLA